MADLKDPSGTPPIDWSARAEALLDKIHEQYGPGGPEPAWIKVLMLIELHRIAESLERAAAELDLLEGLLYDMSEDPDMDNARTLNVETIKDAR